MPPEIRRDLGRADNAQHVRDGVRAVGLNAARLADRERQARCCAGADRVCWLVHSRSQRDDTAQHFAPSGDWAYLLVVDAVLGRDDHSVCRQVREDEVRRPAGVVGLDCQKDDVERLGDVADLTQVYRVGLYGEVSLLGRDGQALLSYRFDILGPLVYERNVAASPGQVASDNTSDCPNAKNRDSVEHRLPPLTCCIRAVRLYQRTSSYPVCEAVPFQAGSCRAACRFESRRVAARRCRYWMRFPLTDGRSGAYNRGVVFHHLGHGGLYPRDVIREATRYRGRGSGVPSVLTAITFTGRTVSPTFPAKPAVWPEFTCAERMRPASRTLVYMRSSIVDRRALASPRETEPNSELVRRWD